MKRSEALSEIRHCGYVGDRSKADLIAIKKGIGTAAAKKEYFNGEKAKKNGWDCECTKCKAKRAQK
jgi:hypothetical protein